MVHDGVRWCRMLQDGTGDVAKCMIVPDGAERLSTMHDDPG